MSFAIGLWSSFLTFQLMSSLFRSTAFGSPFGRPKVTVSIVLYCGIARFAHTARHLLKVYSISGNHMIGQTVPNINYWSGLSVPVPAEWQRYLRQYGTISEVNATHAWLSYFSVFGRCARKPKTRACSVDSVSQKNPPWGLVAIFPKRLGIFQPNFTRLLRVPIYARLQIFIQLPATLTKLCHSVTTHAVHIA